VRRLSVSAGKRLTSVGRSDYDERCSRLSGRSARLAS
jgi:hypothetical protein